MGPPSFPPWNSNRNRPRVRVLASESADEDLCTPGNRPTALRYISSSSRGGHSGTRSARSTSASVVEASVILAISEGRGMARGEIGMAAVDLKHPHLVLCQFSDTLLYTHTLTKINYFNPIEIIVPHTFCEGVQPNQLYQLIKEHYPLVNLTTVQRRHFNDAAGRQHIQTLCAPEYSAVYLQVLHKFYALTAAAAVLKYVEYIQCLVFARESLKIEYHSSENTMVIDVGTATQLELVQPLVPSAGPTCCLLGVLGPTYTVGGIRALRACILQPSCNKEFIENRLDAVQDLIENPNGLMSDLQDVIKKLSEIDKILFLCVETPNPNMEKYGEAQLNQTLLLKTTMGMVPSLVEALNTAHSGRLRKIKMDFENPNYNEIASRIKNVLQEDAHLEKGSVGSLQRCFAVKPEINGLLDVARRMYSELIEDMQKMVEHLGEMYDLPLRVNQNMLKGFHIVMPIAPKNRRNFNVEDLPPIFIQVHNNGASVSMTTEELVVMDRQAKQSLNEIQRISNIVISSLLKELRPFMSSLYKLCENVAELDILLAMAQASIVGSYIRPEFNNYTDIRNSVHPLLDYNSQVTPVPNDIYASPEKNFTIITGPNMGGKSIYIKQIAIMQVMAQLGCFLPATNAVLRLSDRLFSRIGFNDSVELNASTYVLEMKETQHILKSLTPSSLVIIDELCRGTCAEEGTSIAWAICEELLKSDAFTFFTTHFTYLTRLQDLYFNVVNRHTTVKKEVIPNAESMQERLIYQHKVELGTTDIEYYGLALAAKTNLPPDTVKLAVELAELIAETRKVREITTPQRSDEQILYNLNADLRLQSRRNEHSDERNALIIRKFKEDNPQLIERLRIQNSKDNIRTDNTTHNSSIPSWTLLSQPAFNAVAINTINNNEPNLIQNKMSEIKNGLENETTTNSPNDIRNFTSVKSSNELLNTVITNDDNYLKNQHSQNNSKRSTPVEDTKTSSMELDKERSENEQENNSIHKMSNIINNDNVNDVAMSENYANELNNTEDSIQITNSDDSDIAEALTQVLKEDSVEITFSKSDSDGMSVDEELLRETVDEINEEFFNNISIDNIVLTPPKEFCDL
ncbi:mutS protein homolog 4-like [Galleria mellonella]|uniref:MutS protein homolog 4-like n=1 Tax=Galleria mellonella TaxID=7137 RepID=A0ABM3MPU5_GALME|nr:mutS protein homolog 4-like [Galleria mellonella]